MAGQVFWDGPAGGNGFSRKLMPEMHVKFLKNITIYILALLAMAMMQFTNVWAFMLQHSCMCHFTL